MSKTVLSLLKSKISEKIIALGMDGIKIALFLCEDQNYRESNYFHNPAFSEVVKKLYDYFTWSGDLAKGVNFIDWLRDQFRNKNSDRLLPLFMELTASIEPQNYLYYFSKNAECARVCIVAFDNVDSILEKEIRMSFLSFFRSGFNIFKNGTRFVLAIRKRNFFDLSDIGDHGTYIANEVNLGYGEFVDEGKLESEKNANAPLIKINPDLEALFRLKHNNIAKEKFAKMIYERRVSYFKSVMNPRGDTEMSELEDYYRLIIDNERMRVAFFDLCNYDRRHMLVEISNFIFYLVFEVKYDRDNLDLNKSQIEFILESLFYGWIKKYNIFYGDDIYNLPKDVNSWIFKGEESQGANLDYAIFVSVYNATNQVYQDYSFDQHTNCKELIRLLTDIGYVENEVVDRIGLLYKNRATGGHNGLLEISNVHESGLANSDLAHCQISLTPRSYYITLYSNLKFTSIFADIRQEIRRKLSDAQVLEMDDDSRPLTKVKLEKTLRFLCDLAKMNLKWLSKVARKLTETGHLEWFAYYRRHYCLKANYEQPHGDAYGEVLFINLINSIIKFLHAQQSIETAMYSKVIYAKREVIDEFEKLRKLFSNEVKKISTDPNAQLSNADFKNKLQFDLFND